ncbi:hypothetical protein BH09PSE4_BH09PSE4_05440 [soil metagenome]
MPPAQPIGRRLQILLSCIAALAVALPAVIVATAKPVRPTYTSRVIRPQRVVPQAELPPVEPVEFQSLDPDEARAFNADVPFSTAPNPAARPFRLSGSPEDQARAVDCLATAVLYEAGDDALGERAVAQVVINRARHPAFPKTICGVVFQGSERSTGCQFTFTCDGALAAHAWSDVAWARARQIATAALSGSVFAAVGHATHYHTDWVVPYWQSSLDKVAAVHTHLFFRWTGWWGTPPAFDRHVSDEEPVIAQLAALSEAHRGALLCDAAAMVDAAMAIGAEAGAVTVDANTFLIALDPGIGSQNFAALAVRVCGDRPYCKFMGWADHSKVPTGLPLTPIAQAAMSFSYLRDRAHNYEKALWNCAQFKGADPAQCMKTQVYIPAAARVTGTLAPAIVPPPVTATKPAATPGAAPVAAPPAPAKPGRTPLSS